MNIKRAILMVTASSVFLGLAGVLGCPQGSCSSSCNTPSLDQSLINQCTAEHTVPCISQTSCQYVCSNNPNIPGGQGQPCAGGQ